MLIVRKTSRNRLTIPKEIAGKFPKAKYFCVFTRGGNIVLRPVGPGDSEDGLENLREHAAALGIKKRDVDRAIRWARSN